MQLSKKKSANKIGTNEFTNSATANNQVTKEKEKKKVINNHPVEVCKTMTDQNSSKPQKKAMKVENSLRHKLNKCSTGHIIIIHWQMKE